MKKLGIPAAVITGAALSAMNLPSHEGQPRPAQILIEHPESALEVVPSDPNSLESPAMQEAIDKAWSLKGAADQAAATGKFETAYALFGQIARSASLAPPEVQDRFEQFEDDAAAFAANPKGYQAGLAAVKKAYNSGAKEAAKLVADIPEGPTRQYFEEELTAAASSLEPRHTKDSEPKDPKTLTSEDNPGEIHAPEVAQDKVDDVRINEIKSLSNEGGFDQAHTEADATDDSGLYTKKLARALIEVIRAEPKK